MRTAAAARRLAWHRRFAWSFFAAVVGTFVLVPACEDDSKYTADPPTMTGAGGGNGGATGMGAAGNAGNAGAGGAVGTAGTGGTMGAGGATGGTGTGGTGTGG